MELVLRDVHNLHTSLAVKEKLPCDSKCTCAKYQPHAPKTVSRLRFLLQWTMKRECVAAFPCLGAPSAATQPPSAWRRGKNTAGRSNSCWRKGPDNGGVCGEGGRWVRSVRGRSACERSCTILQQLLDGLVQKIGPWCKERDVSRR